MRDELNAGLPSDRFQVDWWVNTKRVERRLGSHPRPALTLADFDAANAQTLYSVDPRRVFIRPPAHLTVPDVPLLLAEIPSDFLQLKAADFELARAWRFFSREMFESCFSAGYLVTDFVYDTSGDRPRSIYVFAHGEATM